MAPSRGFNAIFRARINPVTRVQQRRFSDFTRTATNPSNKTQIYISRSNDPFLNLSIEHYLLQKTPAESTILFLYTNRPCVVIGRNQNPWVEVNLGYLRNDHLNANLVRRRSGGGTVFHDMGNMNYSVICPTSAFDRDKHAEMVVKGLKNLGVHKARVNERHDIVVDIVKEDGMEMPFKISGSAYKLTRLRSLHHGTCLLCSPNLEIISSYLRSPGKPFIQARGVESVSSPVANVNLENASFQEAVVEEFCSIYGSKEALFVGEVEQVVPEISKGLEELKSEEWIYRQTPQFQFSTKEEKGDRKLWGIPANFDLGFTVRNGLISDLDVESPLLSHIQKPILEKNLLGRNLHEITDWTEDMPAPLDQGNGPGTALNLLFGVGSRSPEEYTNRGRLAHGNGEVSGHSK